MFACLEISNIKRVRLCEKNTKFAVASCDCGTNLCPPKLLVNQFNDT